MDDLTVKIDQVGNESLAVVVRDEGEPRSSYRAIGGDHAAFSMR